MISRHLELGLYPKFLFIQLVIVKIHQCRFVFFRIEFHFNDVQQVARRPNARLRSAQHQEGMWRWSRLQQMA